jgi:hypothetical protein
MSQHSGDLHTIVLLPLLRRLRLRLVLVLMLMLMLMLRVLCKLWLVV